MTPKEENYIGEETGLVCPDCGGNIYEVLLHQHNSIDEEGHPFTIGEYRRTCANCDYTDTVYDEL